MSLRKLKAFCVHGTVKRCGFVTLDNNRNTVHNNLIVADGGGRGWCGCRKFLRYFAYCTGVLKQNLIFGKRGRGGKQNIKKKKRTQAWWIKNFWIKYIFKK